MINKRKYLEKNEFIEDKSKTMAYSDIQTSVSSHRNQITIDHDKHYDQNFLSVDFAGNLLGVDTENLLMNEGSEVSSEIIEIKEYGENKIKKLKDKIVKIIKIYGCPSRYRQRAINSGIPDHIPIPITVKYLPKNSTFLGNYNNNSIKLRRDASARYVSPSFRSPHSNNTKISLKHSRNIKTHSEKVGLCSYKLPDLTAGKNIMTSHVNTNASSFECQNSQSSLNNNSSSLPNLNVSKASYNNGKLKLAKLEPSNSLHYYFNINENPQHVYQNIEKFLGIKGGRRNGKAKRFDYRNQDSQDPAEYSAERNKTITQETEMLRSSIKQHTTFDSVLGTKQVKNIPKTYKIKHSLQPGPADYDNLNGVIKKIHKGISIPKAQRWKEKKV